MSKVHFKGGVFVDYKKIKNVALESLKFNLPSNFKDERDLKSEVSKCVALAIAAAFEEYDRQKE